MSPAGRRAFLAAALLLLTSAATIALAQQPVIIVTQPAGGPDLQILSPAAPLPAKERVNLFLSVLNVGPGDVRSPSIFIEPTPGSNLIIVGQAQRDLQDLKQNESGLLVVRLATPDEAGSGALVVTFTFIDDAGTIRTLTRTVSVQISPPKSDPLRMSYDDQPLAKGKPGNVTILLENPSKTAITQLDATIGTRRSTLLTQGDSITPGADSSLVLQGETIPPGGSRLIVFPVKTSLQSEDLLLFTINAHYTYAGFEREQDFDFGARVVGTVLVRVLEAREVPTASGLELAGTIVNVGTGTAWNPLISPGEGSGFRTRAPKLIEDLEPNDAVDFRLPVERISEPEPGAPLLSIAWNDDQGTIHPEPISGEVARFTPPAPSLLARAWQQVLSLWRPLLVVAIVAIGLVIALTHLAKRRREELEEESLDATSASMSTHSRRRPGGKQPGGKQPGGGARGGA